MKKIMGMAAVLVLMLVLPACGNAEKEVKASEKVQTEEAQTEEAQTKEVQTEEVQTEEVQTVMAVPMCIRKTLAVMNCRKAGWRAGNIRMTASFFMSWRGMKGMKCRIMLR